MRRVTSKWALWSARAVIASAAALGVAACSGEDGSSGANGVNGTDGTNGTNGAAGAAGDKGATGAAGAKGADGQNGTNGTNGTDGTDGKDGEQGPAGTTKTIRFAPVNAASTTDEKRKVYASATVTVNGKESTAGYQTLLRSGQTVGANVFGRLVDKNGTALKDTDNSDLISPSNDFSSILKVGDKLFEITHFETIPAAMYISELSQGADGKLTAKSTAPVDFSGVYGLWTPCAGSVSPWNTHLGSEEYPADAKAYENATTVASLGDMVKYYALGATPSIEQAKAAYHPYHHGFIVEVGVDNTGKTTVTKHYAAGRRALELAYVMPDQKTVYLSDDGSNDGFYMFVAKTAGDLSEGTLYAARWFQTSASGSGNGKADIYWMQLGPSAKDSDVKALLDANIQFSQIFDIETGNADGTCPSAASGFKAIHADTGRECLRLKTGQELAASRLESRRYAAYVGATTEFNKTEGITFDAERSRLYVSFSDVTNGMLNDPTSNDLGGPNHIQLLKNNCGAVYEFVISPNGPIGSSYVAESAGALVEGVPVTYPSDSPWGGGKNTCSINGIANPDNISIIPGYGTILIGEDTGSGHQNDVVWAYDLTTREMTRILSTPYGSETTGVYFYPNVNGFAYIKAQVQHPYGESDGDMLASDPAGTAAKQSYTGYIGPLPAMN